MNPYVTRRLQEIRDGKGSWEGLKRPHRKTMDRADDFADMYFTELIPTPSVVPTEDGHVLFVWQENDLDLEIEVSKRDVEFRQEKRVRHEKLLRSETPTLGN